MRVVIALVGMRGAGKTTVGRALAARLGLSFVDTDERVEARLGTPIAELFATGRIADFRIAEAEEVRRALSSGPAIVGTGGGAIEHEATRALLAGAFCAWLACPADVLSARLAGGSRPSITGSAVPDEVPALLARRSRYYAACSRMVVDTSVLGPDEVCDAIEHAWRRFPDHDVR